ncbi:MAG: endonuclease/exonuclease/phosphatase family protein, partial [Actinomycetota bacterium]
MRNRPRRTDLVVGLLACALMVPASGVAPAEAGTPTPVRLKVMSFNIQYGASYSTLAAVVLAIESADADVVGLQEP